MCIAEIELKLENFLSKGELVYNGLKMVEFDRTLASNERCITISL